MARSNRRTNRSMLQRHCSSLFLINYFCVWLNSVHSQISSRTIAEHFQTSSNLYFLFGINVHRAFLIENEQTSAEATVFLIALCRTNSNDCLIRRGSLPADYRLEFSVGDVFYDDQNLKINQQWHRTKTINEDFLFESFTRHSWYDESIWKTYVMNSEKKFFL